MIDIAIEIWILIMFLVVTFLLVPGLLGAPWFPTRLDTVRTMLSMAEVRHSDVVYDLGSGDGRIILTAAKEFQARSVGIEINPVWVIWTRLMIPLYKMRGQVRVVWGSFFRHDLSQADVVVLYLLQVTNDQLKHKLETELKPGTRVVSRTFTFRGWRPIKTDYRSQIYVYKIGPHRPN